MYRKDVLERNIYKMESKEKESDAKPNFAKMAREMGCDYRTAKSAWLKARDGSESAEAATRRAKPSKIDPFRAIIGEKLEKPCTAMALYGFIKTLGYSGGYGLVRNYCRSLGEEAARVATMRFETAPGQQAQVDWKEDMTLRTRDGTPLRFSIFLMVLGFSRAKYVEMTLDRTQPTLMRCMLDAILYFGGSPAEVLFDNMRTVADRSQGEFGQGRINAAFAAFARDCLFEPLLCKAFHPYTKGKAEDLAKLMERLRPYDEEIRFRDERAADMNFKLSNFPGRKTFDDFDFAYQPSVDRARIMDLRTLRFLEEAENVIFIGSSGVGKTHLATAIGIEASSSHVATYFITFRNLVERLRKAAAEGREEQTIKNVCKYGLLIIDEIGYFPVDRAVANLFFQLVAARYERRSIVVTTNQPFSKWGEVFGDPVIANAIIDRLVHHSQIFKITGRSYRIKGLIEEDGPAEPLGAKEGTEQKKTTGM